MGVTYKITDGCAVITFDNPPLNVFGQDMRSGLSAAIDKAVKDKVDSIWDSLDIELPEDKHND